MATGSLSLRRVTPAVGAVVDGVNLRGSLAPETVRYLRQALLDHGVIFIKGQDLNDPQMETFASHFAKPIPEPFASEYAPDAAPVSTTNIAVGKNATSVWHCDTTFVPEPPSFTALRAVRLPPLGGDTCWMSLYAAYDALSKPMQRMLDGLTAVHSMTPVLQRMGEYGRHFVGNEKTHRGRDHTHPLIRVHPETGRKSLYYNEGWTSCILELTPAENEHVIALLREHVKSPDFAMRWCWEPNDVALWDNRAVQHYAVPDYSGERVMQRVVTAGELPVGPKHAAGDRDGQEKH
jgi:taurine dioxygenase